MVVYTRESLLALKRRKKLLISVMVCTAVICAAVCAAGCFFAKKNALAVETVNSVITVLGGWFVLGALFACVLPLNRRIAHVNKLLYSERRTFAGRVEECGDIVTVSRYITATQIKISGGGTDTFYWDNGCGKCPFKDGDSVTFDVSCGFICAYGATDNEE